MWSIPDLRSYLSGSWRLDRFLLDRRNAVGGELTGEAEFISLRGSLVYRERGRLKFGAYEGSAEQSYSYDFPDGDTRAFVRFRDGRPFHELDLLPGRCIASHACGPDLYSGVFVALDPVHWQSSWTVTGPRKNLEIITLYSRLPSS